MASEGIPPPAPPPPPLFNNDNNTVTPPNGPTGSQVHTPLNGGPGMATNEGKLWERAWSVDEMRKGARNWSLASDAGVSKYSVICIFDIHIHM